MDTNILKDIFKEKFANNPRLFRSPGRINLIGEHTDYNEGYVLPAAIDKEMVAAMLPNGQEEICRLYAFDLDEYFEFSLKELLPVKEGWPNYIMGVADQIQTRGFELTGFDCVIGGDVPLGAGLSSSAALECVIAYGLNECFELNLDKIEMIQIAQKAEHTFAGVMCGIMDQFASMMGQKDSVFRLDCRDLSYDYFPLELGDYQVLLINSNVKHSLASTEYNARRLECEKGVGIMKKVYKGINSLRDVDPEMLEEHKDKFSPITYLRCKYVIEENSRVIQSCDALQAGDLLTFGELVYASHHGLSKEYEVSCPELDFLVEATREKDYVLGARMMGGGFGGCTINIVLAEKIESFIEELAPRYENEFGKSFTPIQVLIEEGSGEVL